MAMPPQRPGASRQDYRTPDDFLAAVRERLGIVGFIRDLAADKSNTVASTFFSEDDSAFAYTWTSGTGWNWLNPPFANIAPWVAKANAEAGVNKANTAVLVPASVGSNWWANDVHDAAFVYFLSPRISFDGENPYPKDCALLLYHASRAHGYDCWRWR